MSGVTVIEIRVRAVTVYKILAGADATLSSYNAACSSNDAGLQDWRSLYTQFQRAHVLGTLPYRWENPATAEARLISATFEELDVVVIDGPYLHDGGVDGVAKAAACKCQLGIDEAAPLMPSLGDRGKVALVRETADEWELVIPHALLSSLRYEERGIARFRRHPRMPVTWRWKAEENGWRRWDEDPNEAGLIDCVPDLGMAWLASNAEGGGG